MNHILLIAETPRAANDRHMYLVPPGTKLQERHLARYFSAVAAGKAGSDFIGVIRPVKQVLASGVVREGLESLVLVNVDVARLSPSDKKKVEALLEAKLTVLGELATRQLDRGGIERFAVLEIPELAKWLADPRLSQLPTWRRNRRLLGAKFLMALIAGVCLMGLYPAWQTGGKGSPIQDLLEMAKSWLHTIPARGEIKPSRTPDAKASPRDPVQKRLDTISNKWNCTLVEVVRSIDRARSWDEPPRSREDFLRSAASNSQLANQIAQLASDHEDYLCFVRERQGEEANSLQELVHARKDRSPLKTRQSLFRVYETFSDLHDTAAQIRHDLEALQPSPPAFGNAIVFLGDPGPEVGLGKGFEKPTTPLFDRQDVMILRFIDKSLLPDGAENQFIAALEQADVHIRQRRRLAERLELIRNKCPSLWKTIDEERKEVRNKVADKTRVDRSYARLANLIELLGSILSDSPGDASEVRTQSLPSQ